MNQSQLTLIINIIIGIVFVVGFIYFMFKKTNWFRPGGIAYEFFKSKQKNTNNNKKSTK